MKKNWKTTAVFLLMLVLACALTGCGSNEEAETDTASAEKTVTVDVYIHDQQQSSNELTTTAETLGDLLLESGLAEGEDSQYGLYIQTVDGVTADEAKEEWWCITKNGGETVQTGADSTPIADGERYELTLKTGY